MKNVVIILMVGLISTTAYGAVGDIHDVSVAMTLNGPNPSGDWSFHIGNSNGSAPYDETLLEAGGSHCGQPGWVLSGFPTAVVGGAYTGCNGIDPNEILAHGPAMMRWTVPAGTTGAVEAATQIWQCCEPDRQLRILIRKNASADIAQLNVPRDGGVTLIGTVDNRVVLSPRPLILVSEGDTIDFILDGYGPDEPAQFGTSTSANYNCMLKEVELPTSYNLTVLADPVNVTTVSPIGITTQIAGVDVPISANRFAPPNSTCPEILDFDHWEGPVADVNAATTTVNSFTDITVTAHFVDGRACGDECHPYPTMDFNQNCITDWPDFADFAADWMTDTNPI